MTGVFDRPATPGPNALVLTHGAGSNSNAAILKAVSARLNAHGWTVLRYDLPFRQKHSGPPRPPAVDTGTDKIPAVTGKKIAKMCLYGIEGDPRAQ